MGEKSIHFYFEWVKYINISNTFCTATADDDDDDDFNNPSDKSCSWLK